MLEALESPLNVESAPAEQRVVAGIFEAVHVVGLLQQALLYLVVGPVRPPGPEQGCCTRYMGRGHGCAVSRAVKDGGKMPGADEIVSRGSDVDLGSLVREGQPAVLSVCGSDC